MGTTIYQTLEATFQLVYASYLQYMQNCQAFSEQLNYISFNNCNVTFDTIKQRSQITLQQTCILQPDTSPAYAQFKTNLTQAAIDMANQVQALMDTSAENVQCPDYETTWDLGVGTLDITGSTDCTITTTVNLCLQYVMAVAETMQQTCINSFMQENILVCGDPTPQTWSSVSYEKVATQTFQCVSADASVQAKAQEIIDYVTLNLSNKEQDLRIDQQSLLIACIVVVLWILVLLVLGFVGGRKQNYRQYGVYTGIAVAGFSIWLLLGFYLGWYPYGDVTLSPDIMRSNQKIFTASLIVLGVFSALSLAFSTAQLSMDAALLGKPKLVRKNWDWLFSEEVNADLAREQ